MQCGECQRRGSSIVNSVGISGGNSSVVTSSSSSSNTGGGGSGGGVVGISTTLAANTTAVPSTTLSPPSSTISPLTVSPGSPTPPASPNWKAPSPSPSARPVDEQVPNYRRQQQQQQQQQSWLNAPHGHHRQQLFLSCKSDGADTSACTSSSSASPADTNGFASPPLAFALDGIDLSLPLTSTLLKHAQLCGVPRQRLLGLDRAVSYFPTICIFIDYYSFSVNAACTPVGFIFTHNTRPQLSCRRWLMANYRSPARITVLVLSFSFSRSATKCRVRDNYIRTMR